MADRDAEPQTCLVLLASGSTSVGPFYTQPHLNHYLFGPSPRLPIFLPFHTTRSVRLQVCQSCQYFLYASVFCCFLQLLRPVNLFVVTATMSEGPSSRTGKAASFPDFMLDPNAVLKDHATWRSVAAPNYSNTRGVYERSKKASRDTYHTLSEY